jgi:hypothetical protein
VAKQGNPMNKPNPAITNLVWRAPGGEPLACREKIKVLNENLEEIRSMCQDAVEDAVLMGGDERQIREVLRTLIETLDAPFKD